MSKIFHFQIAFTYRKLIVYVANNNRIANFTNARSNAWHYVFSGNYQILYGLSNTAYYK